jgi:hypothetical protein
VGPSSPRRRSRCPDTLTAADQAALTSAFDRRNAVAATEIAMRLYGLEEHAGLIRGA